MIDILFYTLNLAQAQPSGPPPGANPLMQMLPIILLFAGMWFLIIAPQRKKQKEHEKMIAGLQRGDEIMTSGGIYGEITSVKPERFVVKVADGTRIELGRNFVQSKVSKDAGVAVEKTD